MKATLAAAPPIGRLVGVELRKAVDTRAGAAVLALVVGGAAAGLVVRLGTGSTFDDVLHGGLFGPQLLLPVIGVLVMTAEWSGGTAATTFTLSPRRGRVLVAKILAVLALSTAVALTVAAVAALAAGPPDPSAVLGALAGTTALVVQGVAFGALLQHTTAALVLYFVAPPTWNAASTALLDEGVARWFDLFGAVRLLGRLDPAVLDAPAVVALAVRIVIPLTVGIVRGLRRDVS